MLMTRAHIITATLVFLGIAGGYWLMALHWPILYIWSTYEDLHGEWAQTLLFLTVFLISVRLAVTRDGTFRIFFGLLALACFYVVMEEISWGQRLIGFDSPDIFKRHNLQREANIHNLLVGPYSTLLKDIIEYTLASALALYGFVYPLLLAFRVRPAVLMEKLGIPAPPLYLWPFFVTAAYLETAPFHFNEAEVAELLVGAGLAIMTTHYWFLQRHGIGTAGHAPLTMRTSVQLSLVIVLLVTGVATAAGIITRVVYAQPEERAAIDARILNGYEKFAGRYQGIGMLEVTSDLYLEIHKKEPYRTSILRRLAKTRRQLGDESGFLRYTNKALDIGLERYAANPDRVSTNLSLARTYKQLGETTRSLEHANRAYRIAMKRAIDKPDSAKNAYWLAKTYRQLGKYNHALVQYRKAFDLNPSSTKYRKAYYRMKRRSGE